jgi:hypothetical protein
MREARNKRGDRTIIRRKKGKVHDARRDSGIDGHIIPPSLVHVVSQVAQALKIRRLSSGRGMHYLMQAKVTHHRPFCGDIPDDHGWGIRRRPKGHNDRPAAGPVLQVIMFGRIILRPGTGLRKKESSAEGPWYHLHSIVFDFPSFRTPARTSMGCGAISEKYSSFK